MNKKKRWIVCAAALLLSWCGRPQSVRTETVSTDQETQTWTETQNMIDAYNMNLTWSNNSGQVFFIETQELNRSWSQNISLSKIGRLLGSSNISINANSMWTVSQIRVKEGDTVVPWQILVSLNDSIANYGIQLQRTKVWLERTKLNYQQSKTQLDKAVLDAQNSLAQAENNYSITKEKIRQQQRQAEINLKNAQLSWNSSTSLEIEKLETELSNQLESLKNSFLSQKITAKQLRSDTINYVDSLLGVTSFYRSTANQYEHLMGARDIVTKNKTEQLFLDLKNRMTIDDLADIPSSDEDLDKAIMRLQSIYDEIEIILENMVKILESSLTGPSLTASQIANFKATNNGLRSSYQASYANFVSYKNQVNNIFTDKEKVENGVNTTFQQQIDIVTKNAEIWLENAQIAYDQTLTQNKDSLFQIELAIKMAKENLANAKANRDLQLSLLQNAINDANVSYADASKNYGKLQIKSPINGFIQEILVDKGQDLSNGSPAIKIAGTENNEVIVTADESEIAYLSVGQAVTVRHGTNDYQWRISSIANVADATLSFPVTIRVTEQLPTLWWSVTVSIPLSIDDLTIPLSAIEMIGSKEWIISLWNNNALQSFQVELGTIRNDQATLKTELPSWAELILSDMKNYDPNIYRIEKKWSL